MWWEDSSGDGLCEREEMGSVICGMLGLRSWRAARRFWSCTAAASVSEDDRVLLSELSWDWGNAFARSAARLSVDGFRENGAGVANPETNPAGSMSSYS